MTNSAMNAFAAALLLTAVTACGANRTPAPLAGYSVLLINIDALRADRLGCYGYSRDTSPFIDSLCDAAVVFERASAASTYTRESVAALLTGRLPSKTGAIGWHAAPRESQPTLAERMQSNGYRTGLLSNTVMLNHRGFERGFDRVSHLPARWNLSGEGERLSAAAIEFVREAKRRPVFLYLHYLDPHAPYSPDERFLKQIGAVGSSAPLRLYEDVTPDLPNLRASGFGPGDARFEDLADRYDAEIAATDSAIASLFRGLSELDVLGRMLVIVTSDHGEEFLEHDWVEHGWTLYEESLRVPLLLWAPAILRPVRVATRTSQIDVVPTVIALLGIAAEGVLDGESIFAIDGGSVRPRSDERVQIAELLLARRQITRAVLADDWKYIATWREVPVQDRTAPPPSRPEASPELWGPPVREELYDLRSDPNEKWDRSEVESRRRRELADALAAFRDRGPNYEVEPAGPRDPNAVPAPSAEAAKRLKALGYAE